MHLPVPPCSISIDLTLPTEMHPFSSTTTIIPLFLLLLIPPITCIGHSSQSLKLFKREINCYKGELVCGSGCMPDSATCCGTAYCEAGKYCDRDGCCPNGKQCASPTTFISLGPEPKTSTSASPSSKVSEPASSSSVIVVSPEPTQTGDSLSTGAKAGIGVGVGVGGLAILVGIGIWVVMARKRRRAQSQDGGPPPVYPPVPPMIPPDISPSQLKQELDSKAIVRPISDATLVSSLSPVSPNQTSVVHELDGTARPRSELMGSPVNKGY